MTVIGYIIIALMLVIISMLYHIGNNSIEANKAIRNLLKEAIRSNHESQAT